MSRTSWTDAHERLLAHAAPDVPEPSDADVDALWRRVAASVDERRSHRRRARYGVAVGVALVLAATSGLAAADHFSARTGQGPVDAEDLRLGGPGEKLAPAAPDYGEVVAEETADIPFPDEESRAFAVRDQVHDARFAGTDELVSTGAVRAWVADAALCSWANQWAAATRSGDDDARAEAVDMIRAAPSWPAVAALDPHPFSRWRTGLEDDGHGGTTTFRYLDESQFFYLAALGEAVEGPDLSAVARVLAENNGYCRPGNVPDLPRADALFGER